MFRFSALALLGIAAAQAAPVKTDYQLDGADPGVKLFVRQKMEANTTRMEFFNEVLKFLKE